MEGGGGGGVGRGGGGRRQFMTGVVQRAPNTVHVTLEVARDNLTRVVAPAAGCASPGQCVAYL